MPDKPRKPGRPATMRDGRRIQVWLDAETISRAEQLGNGSVSAGIRAAIATASPTSPPPKSPGKS